MLQERANFAEVLAAAAATDGASVYIIATPGASALDDVLDDVLAVDVAWACSGFEVEEDTGWGLEFGVAGPAFHGAFAVRPHVLSSGPCISSASSV